jgi:hypothetical protein
LTVLSYGAGSPLSTNLAFHNFVRPGIDVLSFCTTPIELLSNDGNDDVLSTATGFFWKTGGGRFLVTNWHVVSGREPFSGKAVSDLHYIPGRIAFFMPRLTIEGKNVILDRQRIVVTFGDAVQQLLETPPTIAGGPVDIWAMRLPESFGFARDPARKGFVGAEASSCFINEASDKRVVTQAGDDCFLLGYPLKNYSGGMFPVWKRGSIASDTSIGVDNRPIFLVDAATTAGMSGSPVIRRVTTFAAQNNDIGGAIQEFHAHEFVGVYAGRLQNKQLEATNIGYVWYRSLLPSVLAQFETALAASLVEAD